jgi:DNA ligase (NAD+)
MLEKMKQLVEKLNKASNAYYNSGNPIMSDREFDLELTKLKHLEEEIGVILSNSPTQNVGFTVLGKLNKIKHEHKLMLSLAKVHSAEEIIKFANGKELIAMIKLDGLSVRLTYEDGQLVKAETRGNGIEGSDITEHVKQFKNIPLTINKKGAYVVDGEAIITDEDFESINAALPVGEEKYKNSRNLASGTLALLDTSLIKERHLRFILWDVIVGDDNKSFRGRLCKAMELGFTVTVHTGCELKKESINIVNETVLELAKREGYPCDGVVWKFNDIAYGESLGQTSHHFNNAVAFKPVQDVYETVLRDIEWSMGKTGQLTPVAIFDPVEIDGTEVSRASVHNWSMVQDLELGIGDTVTVYKANMIIPQIADNLTRSGTATFPDECPICGGLTKICKENDTKVITCSNDNCKGKLLGKLSHAVSKNALNIDGMSEATIEFMINELGVKSIKDLYNFPFYPIVRTKWKNTQGFGEKSVDKILAAIEKSRETTMDRVLYAQSISLIGRTASKDIAKYCKNNIKTFCNIMENGNQSVFLSIDGFGETMLKSLEKWADSHWDEFLELLKEFNFSDEVNEVKTSKNLEGKTFVITGSLEQFKNRNELVAAIESAGGKVSGSVSAKTSYLINNDINSNSSKNTKAKSLGVEIITEQDFINMIN